VNPSDYLRSVTREVVRQKFRLSRNDSGVWGDEYADDGTIVLRSTEVAVDGRWQITSPAVRRLAPAERRKALVRTGDLIVTTSSGSRKHIGKTALVTDDVAAMGCAFANFMQRLRLGEGHDPRFYGYLLNAPVGREQMFYLGSTTTGLMNLNGTVLGDIEVPDTAPSTQRAIADFLDRKTAAIDALIEKKERLIALLAEKRAALIHRAVTKGLDPDVPMKDSGVPWIGEIPAHWVVSSVKFEFDNLNSRRIPLSAEERGKRSGEYPYYGASNIIDYLDDYLFDETTILVAEDGANLVLRNLPLAIIATGKYWVNNHAHILRPRDGAFHFWAPLLESLDYRPFISGSAQPKLTAEAIGNVEVGVPPTIDERRSIAARVTSINAALAPPKQRLKEQTEKLLEYRQAIITAAVTGQLDIGEDAA
jgi:type I restriction enzyme S subunit